MSYYICICKIEVYTSNMQTMWGGALIRVNSYKVLLSNYFHLPNAVFKVENSLSPPSHKTTLICVYVQQVY